MLHMEVINFHVMWIIKTGAIIQRYRERTLLIDIIDITQQEILSNVIGQSAINQLRGKLWGVSLFILVLGLTV